MEIRGKNDNEKDSPKYESEYANKEKNEQQNAIKHLKEYCDIDKIEIHEKIGLCL